MLQENHVVEERPVLSGVSEKSQALVNLSSDYLRAQCVEVGDGDDDTIVAGPGQISFAGIVV